MSQKKHIANESKNKNVPLYDQLFLETRAMAEYALSMVKRFLSARFKCWRKQPGMLTRLRDNPQLMHRELRNW